MKGTTIQLFRAEAVRKWNLPLEQCLSSVCDSPSYPDLCDPDWETNRFNFHTTNVCHYEIRRGNSIGFVGVVKRIKEDGDGIGLVSWAKATTGADLRSETLDSTDRFYSSIENRFLRRVFVSVIACDVRCEGTDFEAS